MRSVYHSRFYSRSTDPVLDLITQSGRQQFRMARHSLSHFQTTNSSLTYAIFNIIGVKLVRILATMDQRNFKLNVT